MTNFLYIGVKSIKRTNEKQKKPYYLPIVFFFLETIVYKNDTV